MVKPQKYVIFAQNYPKYLKIYDYKIHTYILFMKYSHIIPFSMENSLINKGKTHSLYTFRHMNPQDVKFQLFWVILNKKHVFFGI